MKSKRNRIIALVIVLLLSFLFFYQGKNINDNDVDKNEKIVNKVNASKDKKTSAKKLEDKDKDVAVISKEKDADTSKDKANKTSDKNIESSKPSKPTASSDKGSTPKPPAKKPTPQTEKVKEEDPVMYASIYVRANTALNNLDKLDNSKHHLIPSDGLIYSNFNVKIEAGDSAFDLLNKQLKAAKIHLDFAGNPLYDSVYIKGINNLYEFDCGQLSGWMYKVNGQFLGYGASNAILKDGDVVEFVYTCDMGADVGNSF